jgi:hypothetical protein
MQGELAKGRPCVGTALTGPKSGNSAFVTSNRTIRQGSWGI